jgi:hypothetical protein
MEGAMHLLASGGLIPQYTSNADEKVSSPRRRGVKQGAMMFLLALVLVPALGVFSSFAPGRIGTVFEFFTALTAILGFLGGALRMLYAGIFEEGAPPKSQFMMPTPYAPPVMAGAHARAALPPAAISPAAASWRQRPQTAEIQQPPSVTDNTTRLLDKKEPGTE